MKILYDHQAFGMQTIGGVSNCFVKLIENLPCECDYKISLVESDNKHLKESNLNVCYEPQKMTVDKFLNNTSFKGKGIFWDIYKKVFPERTSEGRNMSCSIEALEQGNFDIFHPTFFKTYFLPHLHGKPFVITVHDMILEKYYHKKDWQFYSKRELASKASHIIAVSEKTKFDIEDMWNIPESKITVIYHGAPKIKKIETAPLYKGKYILYVGRRHTYKSFIPMMKSLIPILRNHDDISIVCTGPSFNNQEDKWFKSLGIRDKIVHICPDDSGLMNLYANALCFIFPSVYEGFGIPILEAYQASCPVLLNNKSCFPEIAKDAAIFFNLDENYSDLDNVMERFLQMSDEEKKLLLQKENARLKDFSWKESAKKLSDVYHSIV